MQFRSMKYEEHFLGASGEGLLAGENRHTGRDTLLAACCHFGIWHLELLPPSPFNCAESVLGREPLARGGRAERQGRLGS